MSQFKWVEGFVPGAFRGVETRRRNGGKRAPRQR